MMDSSKAYTSSIHYDRRLYKQDVAGSMAHVRMLVKQEIIPKPDAEAIIQGLEEIRQEIEHGKFPWRQDLEDIHMNIEVRLREKIHEAAGWLHTGRSRNDQIATDLRLYCKEAIAKTIHLLRTLQNTFLCIGEENRHVVLPGYTHLQRAQPVLLAHHMLAYFEMFERDEERFSGCYDRTDVLPLGSGALAGVPYPVDREWVARELGFGAVSRNSMDAVSDRDFVVEFQACASTCMMHCSRMAEELVLWSSQEFGFVRMDDQYTTGSSIMPQKRNPDLAELARAKTGRVYGHLMSILTVLKGLPLTYNRDLQEDKEGLFDTVDTLHATLEAISGMVSTILVLSDATARAVDESYILATDLADYLVGRGVPFREAHRIVVGLSHYAQERGKSFGQLSMDEYHEFSDLFDDGVYRVTVESSLHARNVYGGTSPKRVEMALHEARGRLEAKQ